jgi:hypothetical protein
METWATFPRAGSVEADAPQARQAVRSALPDAGGDGPGVLERGGRGQLEVEGDERRAGGHERRAAARVDPGGAEVGRELAAEDPAGQLRGAAAAQLGARAAAAEGPVEEAREHELLPEQVRGDERLGARRAAAGGVEVDHGDDVHRADVRVASGVRAQVDAVECLGDPGVEGAGQDAGPACEREHGAPVIGSEWTSRTRAPAP